MRFNKMVMASFLALSLVACGGDEDKSRPDDDKIRSPEKSEDCIAAGDKCRLIDGQWIIEEDEKPAPVIDGEFNYSDIGVTDELLPERKGFGFYHRGDKSPLDAKRFPKTRPTLSPIVAWSSAKEYDTDLYNYVAITPHAEKSGKGALKYMFDEIGIKNGKLNKNEHALGGNSFDIGGYWGIAGNSSYGHILHTYYWHSVPALVNTLMWRDEDGNTVRAYADVKNKIWWNDEASVKGADDDGGGSGKQSVRVYGVNSFLQDYGTTLLPDGEFNEIPQQKYILKNRPNDGPYLRHANFVYWLPSDRKSVAYVEGGNLYLPEEVYRDDNPNRKEFPTATKVGELKYVQFGRITGSGVSPDAPKMSGYDDPALRLYPFAAENNVLTGNRLAEDWYFARGTEGTPIEKLDQLKSEGGKIVYDGMAVMFGLDYEPYKRKSANDSKKDSESGKSTNSVMPDLSEPDPEGVVTRRTPVDGKQNLLRLVWTPDVGHVNGAVFGVWTVVDYWAATKATTQWKLGEVVEYRESGGKLVPDTISNTGKSPSTFDPANTSTDGLKNVNFFVNRALRIDVLKNTLVELKGSRIEGTNSFSGVAIRTRDGDKGTFAGGFFGPDASEVGGVINSQTGSMNNPELTDPAFKWGGAFGAQSLPDADETLEYLDFPDDPHFDYDSSNEVF